MKADGVEVVAWRPRVLDPFSRRIVGWTMRDHLPAELTIAALVMAP